MDLSGCLREGGGWREAGVGGRGLNWIVERVSKLSVQTSPGETQPGIDTLFPDSLHEDRWGHQEQPGIV